MARHRMSHDSLTFASEAHFLNPRNEKTAIARTENVHHHHHHPEAKRGWQNQVFRAGSHRIFYPRLTHTIDQLSIDMHHSRWDAVNISTRRAHHTVDKLRMHAISVRIIQEEKFHPAGPEEQTAQES